MRKLIAVAAMICGFALSGCQTTLPSVNISNAVALNTVYGIENGYGIAVNAANAYKALPLCATGTKPSATLASINAATDKFLEPLPPDDGNTTT
jgi:hypothetical protein